MSESTLPSFYAPSFLLEHSASILEFYDDRVVDQEGGYFQNFFDDGSTFAPNLRQLVSSTRIIVNYARASQRFARPEYRTIAEHGLDYLEKVHWQASKQIYAWTLDGHTPDDLTQQAYGYAFVLLAYAAVQKAGIRPVTQDIARVFELMEERFWQPEFGLYADELSEDGVLSSYRGQNANMHICEALISAYEATGEEHYLSRAERIAENITVRQAGLSDGLIWEHYTSDFQIDWEYNRDDPKNLYRPWGFQPGHQTEWSKLLVSLYRKTRREELLKRACELFDRAFVASWDEQFGGLVYGFDPQGNWCDDDKYFWVQAESFAAAAMLYQETDNPTYLRYYEQIWEYSWQHFVDHNHGAWYRILRRNNEKYSDEKSSAGAKCDYHTLGACLDVLSSHPIITKG